MATFPPQRLINVYHFVVYIIRFLYVYILTSTYFDITVVSLLN